MRLPSLTRKCPDLKQDPEAHWFYIGIGGAVAVLAILAALSVLSVVAVAWSLS
jgi:hypothetical protein